MRDHAELFRRLLELGAMDPQQLELARKHTGRIDHERRLLEFIQRIEEERGGLVGRIRVVELGQPAIQLSVSDRESRGRVIRMAVFPKGSQHQFRTMAADGARDESPILGRIDEPAIRQVERFAGGRAHECGCLGGFDPALLERPSGSHFAVRHVHDGEVIP